MTQDSRLLLEEQKPDDSIPPISVLMYHQVGRFQAPKTHRASFCHIRRFRAQMRFLKKFGYHVISLQQALVGLFQGISLPRKSVVLTFDDGYQNFREYAFPVLQEHGFPTTVFLVSGLLGRKAKWLEDDGRYAPPLMDTTTIRELSRQGVSFGSHTVSHVRLSQVNIGRMREEIFSSKAKLEDLLGERVDHFCYPYGDYDERTRDTVAQAGYASALTCIRGAANEADNAFEVPRKAISYGDNLIGYVWKLHLKHKRKDPK